MKVKKPIRSQIASLETILTNPLFELITIDYLQFDQCKGGYKHLLVEVHHFTKFVQAFPTKNKLGTSAADILFNNFFLEFRFPKRILHGHGKEFDNKLFKRLTEITGVKSSKTTP